MTTSTGTVIALFTIGGMFGALSCAYLGDVLGRRRIIFLTNLTTIIGAILMASSFDLAQFIVARLVVGLGIGGNIASVPVWQSEISPASKRGSNVVIDGVFIGIGVTSALWIDLGFFFVKGNSVSWRFPLAVQIVLSLISMVFITLLPESPRWFVMKGRADEAREVLAALQGLDQDSDAIINDMRDMETSITNSGSGSWLDILKMGDERFFHRVYLAATGQLFQQLCGVNVITYYATTIFQQYLGFGPVDSRIMSASMSLVQPLGGLLGFFTIDRLGRRPLLLWCASAMAICMALLAGTTSTENNTGALVVAVVILYVFQFVFTAGYSGLTFLYAAEITPVRIRASANAISTATLWIFNFLLAEVTPVAFDSIDNRYYIVFAVCNAVMVLSVYFFFPETKGRTLEEIDALFMRSKSIFDPPRVAKSLPKIQAGQVGVIIDEAASDKVVKEQVA